ncbi:MAG: hypothetical protein Q7R72_01805 [bacterium]|nr:hypothetical protein [bacterium]
MNRQHIVWVVVGIIIIMALAFWFWPVDKVVEAPSLENIVVETPQVAPSTNPLDNAVPTANLLEKTNPFKNEYKNPFE